jgi:thiamine-phosphate diphosphorylase
VIPSFHLVTSDQVLASDGFLERALVCLAAGGEGIVLHLRLRATPVRAVLEIAGELLRRCSDSGGRISLNDRLDLALVVGSGWAHLGCESLPGWTARELMGEDAVLGRSVHTRAEAEGAGAELDYLIAGNVFDTPSHAERPGRGLGFIDEIRTRATVPLIAIGGVSTERVGEVVAAGAAGVAVLSGVWSSGDPGEAVTRYLQALSEAGTPALLPVTRTLSQDV